MTLEVKLKLPGSMGSLTSAAVWTQKTQEAVAGAGDAVTVAIAVAGTALHRLCRKR